MKQFTMTLQRDRQRPTVYLGHMADSYAMIDTGALFPVWCGDEDILVALGAVPVAYDKSFGGFGGTAKGTIYRIPIFQFGELIYPELPLVASPVALPCQMLLSATMFDGLIYEIDAHNKKLNVTIPDRESYVRRLVIEDRNGKLHVLCTGEEA